MKDDQRPNFTVVRCCKNCHYYKLQPGNVLSGNCTLVEPNKKTLVMCTCDAHTWVKSRTILQLPALRVGAKLPDDAI